MLSIGSHVTETKRLRLGLDGKDVLLVEEMFMDIIPNSGQEFRFETISSTSRTERRNACRPLHRLLRGE